jgi:hypothetical protein
LKEQEQKQLLVSVGVGYVAVTLVRALNAHGQCLRALSANTSRAEYGACLLVMAITLIRGGD